MLQVFPEKHVMPRLFNEAIAAHYEQLYQQRGITILKARPSAQQIAKMTEQQSHRSQQPCVLARAQEERVARIVGDAFGRATGVQLQSGATLPADLVVVGIGARPVLYPFEALQQAAAPPGGIQVDGQLAARGPGVPDGSVFAVGDAACIAMPLYGCAQQACAS
jgi:monodehydroascorbate reductase (NADH)